MRRLRNFLALSSADRRGFLRAVAVLAWVRWTLGRRGLAAVEARTRRVMAAAAGRAPGGSDGHSEAESVRLLRMAQRALPGQSTCLQLAAALRLLLARRGIASELRFGVRKERGRFMAHAWLECRGHVLIGGDAGYERFAVLRGIEAEGDGERAASSPS